jgi:hypothetical protein
MPRHCEEQSDAASQHHGPDRFAALAMTKMLFACAILMLAGCKDNRPPAPTADQARQLNDAEQMLNAMAQNEEGPEANASGPSR